MIGTSGFVGVSGNMLSWLPLFARFAWLDMVEAEDADSVSDYMDSGVPFDSAKVAPKVVVSAQGDEEDDGPEEG